MIRIHLIPVLCLLSLKPLMAQEVQFNTVLYDETKGLSSRKVRCMLQDSQGFMWFGTPDGLNRFDGYSFITLRKNQQDSNSLRGNFISCLDEDKNGNLWIGFYTGGISHYNQQRGKFTHYTLQNVGGHNFQGVEITALYADSQGKIWAGLRGEGMVYLDPETGESQGYSLVDIEGDVTTRAIRRAYNNLYKIYETPNGLFYLITHNGLYSFDRKTRQLQALHDPAARQNPMHEDVFISYATEGDVLWLGAWAGGLSSYNTQTGEWKHYTYDTNIQPTTNIVSGLHRSGQDTLWLTTHDRGFGYFHIPTASFRFINEKAGLPGGIYYGLMLDKEGTFWMNNDNGVVSAWKRVDQFVFEPVNVNRRDHSFYHSIYTVFENDRYRLAGTWWADGLQVYNKHTKQHKTLAVEMMKPGEQLQMIMDIQQDSRGNIWVVSRDYLYRFDTIQERLQKVLQPPIFSPEHPTNYLLQFTEDRNRNYWLATAGNGVFCYNPELTGFTHYKLQDSSLTTLRSVNAVAVDDRGRVWIGGKAALVMYEPEHNAFLEVPLSCNGITASLVLSLLSDNKGNMYAGTEVGLIRFNAKEDIPVPARLYTAEDGLHGDIVSNMNFDDAGNIWCITQTSLCVLYPGKNQIDYFGYRHGITQTGIGNTVSRLPGGYMALATDNGYYRFRPSVLEARQQWRTPVITSFRVYEKEYYFQKELNKNGFIRLEPDENSCSFEFSVLDYRDDGAYQYLYKLEGMDDEWIRAEGRRYAGYTNLPGGNYTFRVKATNRIGDTDVPELSIPIYVETIFYSTWWFRTAVLLLAGGALFGYYRKQIQHNSRIYQLQNKAGALEKEKALVMYESLKQQLNPHFLFNSLASLSSLIRIDQKLAVRFLDSLSKMYRYILRNRDHETVALKDELQFVQMYILLQQSRFEEALQININIDQSVDQYKIVPVTLQNLIENAIKHNIATTDTPLIIEMFIEGKYLVVRNNLQKKNFVETSNRQGLANFISFYKYLCNAPVCVAEDAGYFIVKIPLL